jgi:starch-binding outer membrane protein, SusD/RagB family
MSTMIKKYTCKLVVALLMLSAMSCESWLALEPQDAITRQEYWRTKEQVEAAVFGTYASLLGTTDGQRSIVESMFLWGEMRADMAVPNVNAQAPEIEIANGNILETNTFANWRSFYKTINFCNTVIEFAPQVLESDPTFKQSQLDAYLAEMLTIRSLMYFYLVRTFKEVPLKITPTVSDEDEYELPKSTEAEIIAQILSDLAKAESMAVVSYDNVDENKGRITRFAVNALQADVYLWAEDYANTIIACDKIINSGQFGLVNGRSWFVNQFVVGNSNESIFELQFDEQKTNPFFDMLTTNRRWLASALVLEEFYTIDFINPDNKDVRADGASLRSDGRIWKYLGLNESDQRTSAQSYAHWIVYRYADILLLKAEALAHSGGGEQALEIIDQIRVRANALEATERGIDPTDVDGLTDYILEERAREFAFEGKRWFDILRNAKRNDYARIDILVNMAVRSAPPDRQQTIINKLLDYNSHYLPIYFTELQTNRQLEQNPFYNR